MAETILTPEARDFIISSLACFDTPTTVARAVKERFSIDITRQSVEHYDPNKACGTKDAGVRALFDETRKAFLEERATIGILHRSTRMRRLERLYDIAEARGALKLAAELLEQAAKEAGDAFSNRREITGKDGGPIETRKLTEMTDAELLAIAASSRD